MKRCRLTVLLLFAAHAGRAASGPETGWLGRVAAEAVCVTRAAPRLAALTAPPLVVVSAYPPVSAPALPVLALQKPALAVLLIPGCELACMRALPPSPPAACIRPPAPPSVSAPGWTLAGPAAAGDGFRLVSGRVPVWSGVCDRRMSCCSVMAPAPMPLLPPHVRSRAAAWSTPLPAPAPVPVPPGFAERAQARLVRDGLADGTLNPRSPEWRPHLAFLLHEAPFSDGAPPLFDLLLAGCAGHDARARLTSLENWASGHLDGRHAGVIAYHAARQAFDAADYPGCIRRCETLARQPGETAARALMLLALARVQTGDFAAARGHLSVLERDHAASEALPESRFLLAWIAIQEQQLGTAAALLRELVARFPGTPAAAKAVATLDSLQPEGR